MASESNRFHKLKGRENYDTWKISAKSYLVIKKLWMYVQNDLPSDATNAQKEADLTAWSELTLLIDESIYSYIAETNNAKDAWKALESAFEDSGLCRKVGLLKQLVQLKLSDCMSMEEYINQMTMTSLKVKKTGLKLDDEIIASLMLAGLPNEFNPLVMAIENSSQKLTIEGVKTLLLQETRFDSRDDNDGTALFSRSNRKVSNKNNFRCHYCGEAGHFVKNCPEKRNSLKASAEDVKKDTNYANYERRGSPL